jgi:hypothetical protein
MKLYVPDPQKWVDYFERMNAGKIKQTGAGTRACVIPIEDSKTTRERKQLTIRAVLPSEQAAAIAKSELEREGINPKEVAKAFQSDPGKREGKSGEKRKKPITVKRAEGDQKAKKTKKDIFENL